MDLSNLEEAKKTYRLWVEKCSILAGRLDNQMRRAYGADTDYKTDVDRLGVRVYWGKDEDEARQRLKDDINLQLSKLRTLSARVKYDQVRHAP